MRSRQLHQLKRGSHGNPGEKLARFSPDREVISNITINGPFSIFWQIEYKYDKWRNGDKAMPSCTISSSKREDRQK